MPEQKVMMSSSCEVPSGTGEPKQLCGFVAVDDWITRDGMKIGMGTGSTVKFVVDRFGELIRQNNWTSTSVVCTSEKTEKQCRDEMGKGAAMKIMPVADYISGGPGAELLDIAIDGADSVDMASGALVKGGGGAHLREKRVEEKATVFVVVVDDSKICSEDKPLGRHFPIPVEIPANPETDLVELTTLATRIRDAALVTDAADRSNKVTVKLRLGSADKNQKDLFRHVDLLVENEIVPPDMINSNCVTEAGKKSVAGGIFASAGKTDNGNIVVDVEIEKGLPNPAAFAAHLDAMKTEGAIVEHGLFLQMTDHVIVAYKDGSITKKEFPKQSPGAAAASL